MSVHLPVEYVVGLAVLGFADHLGAQGAGDAERYLASDLRQVLDH
jgi:hypothetical protein